jgi:ribonucleoside-diphosphate reductase alpha chain
MSLRSSIVLPQKRVTGTLNDRLTENARERILPARYLRQDETGAVVETPAKLFRRVAKHVARAETEYDGEPSDWTARFYRMLSTFEFVPNSPTLMNAGTGIGQLAACFVISPEDTLESIFETLEEAAAIFQSGGGVGYSFSALRPAGDPVGETGGVASGPVSFMRVFDSACEQIRQGGRRRGAQMAVLRVDHPDIARFCLAKHREGELANFNISVGVTDAFTDTLRRDGSYPLVNPRTGETHLATGGTVQFYSPAYENAPRTTVSDNFWRDYASDIPDVDRFRGALTFEEGDEVHLPAAFVWTLVVDGAWRNGEPGVFAVDEANREHSFDVSIHPEHTIEATNPCGEQPLENFEACTLGHVNLSLFAGDDLTPWFDLDRDRNEDLSATVDAFLERGIDWDRLDRVVRDGVRFLDNVVTVSAAPVEAIRETADEQRKIGLGVMGFAELLVQLGVRYGTPESVEVARVLMRHIDHVSKQASHDLAEERGSFPAWVDSKYADPTAYPDWFRAHVGEDPDDWVDGYPIRNHSTTTVAPTGTTSMLANASPGCEPFFNVVYFKNVDPDVQGEEMLVEFDEYFFGVLAANEVDVAAVRAEAERLLRAGEFTGPADLPIPEEITDLFVLARDVSPADHVRVQAAFQEGVDSGVSKTINAAPDATREDVDDAFHLALELGCKGVTVYRDRSREEQVLTTRTEEVCCRP